jgi:hypothetical protein
MSQINVTTIRNRTGGAPNLDRGIVVGAAATFSGNVSVGGTLTYEDVTNVDSVGIVTARTGIKVLSGAATPTGGSGPNAGVEHTGGGAGGGGGNGLGPGGGQGGPGIIILRYPK